MLKQILSDERRGMIDLINKNGGYNGRKLPDENPFNDVELESILEYEDPRVIVQPEYSFESYFRDENDSVRKTHNTINFSHINYQQDLKLAQQLGGYTMRNRIQKVSRPRSDSSRRKKIYNILQLLPEKYRPIKDHIIQYDLDRLTVLCEKNKAKTIRKVCLLLVEDRAVSLGMYTSQDELRKIFVVEKTGLMKIKGDLMQANMFGRVDRKLDTMKNAAFNLLIELKDLGIIGKLQSLKAQSRISELDQFPRLLNGNKHMDLVITISALMIDRPDLDLSTLTGEIEEIRGIEPRKYYQAVRRAQGRSIEYVEYINSPVLVQSPLMGVEPQIDTMETMPVTPEISLPEINSVKVTPVEIEEVNSIGEIDQTDKTDEISIEVPAEVISIEENVEECLDTFNVCWQSSDEVTTGTWFSSDTFAMDGIGYFPEDISAADNTPLEVENRGRKSGMIFLNRNDYLIQKLMRSDRIRETPERRERPLLVIHSAIKTVHGKGPPYN